MHQYPHILPPDIEGKYRTHKNRQILEYGYLKITVGIGIILYFTFLDLFVQGMPESLYFRVPALAVALNYIVLDRTLFKKNTKRVTFFYNLFLFSLQYMMIGKVLIAFGTDHLVYAIQGTVIVIAVMGIEFRARRFYAALFFIAPSTFLVFASVVMLEGEFYKVIYDFSHIISMALISLVLSITKENLQIKSFQSQEDLKLERNRSNQLYNNMLKQNKEIELQKEEIETQKEEIVSQRDFARRQRDWIIKQKDEITDSILYAKRIQDAILPSFAKFKTFFSDAFVIYRPKDIVSGDFYWYTTVDEYVVFTVADCTGHGVPGAFMSMLGITLLDQIVKKSAVTCSKCILDQLRQEVIKTLKQFSYDSVSKDGLDLGICVYNTKTMQLFYSGANSTMIHVRKTNEGKVVNEYQGDKMPVSFYYRMDPYNGQMVQLKRRDVIYLYTDGYPDQFGGPKGKKFKSRPFKELLIANSEMPMSEQSEQLESTLSDWMRPENGYQTVFHEQNDDITVMGIRV